MLHHTDNYLCHKKCNERTKNISGNNTRKAFDRFCTKKKAAILGTSHLIRKIPQSERVWEFVNKSNNNKSRRTGQEENKDK
jgi:hypothetical protein